MLTKFISIEGYSPEVRAFGTFIKSTKVVTTETILVFATCSGSDIGM